MEGADTLQETGGNVNSISVSNSGEGIGCGSGGSAVSSAAAAAALLGPLSRGLQSLASRLLLLGGGRGQDEYTFSDLGVLEARLSGLRPFASSSGYGCGGGASDTFDGAAAAAIAAAAGAAGSVVAAGALVEIVRAWSSSSSDRNLQAAGLSDDLRPPGQRGGGRSAAGRRLPAPAAAPRAGPELEARCKGYRGCDGRCDEGSGCGSVARYGVPTQRQGPDRDPPFGPPDESGHGAPLLRVRVRQVGLPVAIHVGDDGVLQPWRLPPGHGMCQSPLPAIAAGLWYCA